MSRRAIFILGMHRSGTSMVAGVLRTLRVELGRDQELMGPAIDNPKGFFEHIGLYEINVEILSRLGGDWWQIPVFPDHWETSDLVEDLKKRAASAIKRSFGGSPIWCFKDPRLSLTMPFWRMMAGCPILPVIMIRNPLDVAKSLNKRNTFPIALGAEIWRRYTLAAIANTSGMPRLPVLYEDFLSDVDPELGRLAGFCGLPWWKECRGAARAFAEDGMRNERSSTREMESHPEISAEVKRLYLGIRANAKAAPGRRGLEVEASLDSLARTTAARP